MKTSYILSCGRAEIAQTPGLLEDMGMPYFIVVEPQEAEAYGKRFGSSRVLAMERGYEGWGLSYARNFAKQHSRSMGDDYHWQFDDNIKWFGVRSRDATGKEKNIKLLGANSRALIFQYIERWAGQYKNVGLCGLTYAGFAFAKTKALSMNCNCFTSIYVNNAVPVMWRHRLVEDVDYAAQVLYANYCTIQFNRLLMEKNNAISGGLTEFYATPKQLEKVQNTQAQWPGWFEYKECERMERIGGKMQKLPTYRLKPSRIWAQFKFREPARKVICDS